MVKDIQQKWRAFKEANAKARAWLSLRDPNALVVNCENYMETLEMLTSYIDFLEKRIEGLEKKSLSE